MKKIETIGNYILSNEKWFFIDIHWSFTRIYWIFIYFNGEGINESMRNDLPSNQQNRSKPNNSKHNQNVIYRFVNDETNFNSRRINWRTTSRFNSSSDLTIVIIEDSIEYALQTLFWVFYIISFKRNQVCNELSEKIIWSPVTGPSYSSIAIVVLYIENKPDFRHDSLMKNVWEVN